MSEQKKIPDDVRFFENAFRDALRTYSKTVPDDLIPYLATALYDHLQKRYRLGENAETGEPSLASRHKRMADEIREQTTNPGLLRAQVTQLRAQVDELRATVKELRETVKRRGEIIRLMLDGQ